MAPDAVPLRLTRYRGGMRGPILLAHGLGVSSRIFSTDTIGTNLVEFLCAQGFDVWLADLRVSIDLAASDHSWTADDVAMKDFPALARHRALRHARQEFDALVHCFGATTLLHVGARWTAGHAIDHRVADRRACGRAVAASTRRVRRLPDGIAFRGLTTLSARTNVASGFERVADSALAWLPRANAEQCTSATCHRISALGRLYQHEQLSPETHDALPDLFGKASLAALEQVAAIVRRGRLVTARGGDEYLPHVARLALPVTFIHGALNGYYWPESTAATHDLLRRAHGDKLYERHVVPRYGHLDCIFGKNASLDVYPLMLRHLNRVGS